MLVWADVMSLLFNSDCYVGCFRDAVAEHRTLWQGAAEVKYSVLSNNGILISVYSTNLHNSTGISVFGEKKKKKIQTVHMYSLSPSFIYYYFYVNVISLVSWQHDSFPFYFS